MEQSSLLDKVPPEVYYIPNFINESEEESILNEVNSVPKPKWTQLSNRRLQNWGGIPHPKGMIAETIPGWLNECIEKVYHTGAFPEDKRPNHVLVNEYLPGQGILLHLDGPLFYPTISTITCGSHTLLHFHPPQDKYETENNSSKIASLLLERRSLVIIKGDMYHKYPHSIQEQDCDIIDENIANLGLCSGNYKCNDSLNRGTRISLTIRHVPQTTKFKIKLGR